MASFPCINPLPLILLLRQIKHNALVVIFISTGHVDELSDKNTLKSFAFVCTDVTACVQRGHIQNTQNMYT